MPEEPEKSGAEPNLELPSLFGRGRKKKRQAEEPTEETAESTEAIAAEPEASTPTDEPAATGPVPVEGSTRRLPPTPPPPSRETEETAPIQAATAPPVDPPVEPVPAPVPVEPTPAPPAPEPVPEPAPVEPPAPTPAPARVEPSPEPTPEPQPAPVEETAVLPGPVPLDEPAPTGEGEVGAPLFADEVPAERRAAKAPKPPEERKERTPLKLPPINPRVAALVTGLVVGFVGVVLSFGASQGCESVRGVGSCGGIGLFALLAVLVVEVLLGAAMLKAFGVVDPTSTSFLGVGLVAVLALLFFLSALDSVWMLLVLPLLTAVTFLLSWWVTETFVEQGAGDDLHR